jgi:hypothetical protein
VEARRNSSSRGLAGIALSTALLLLHMPYAYGADDAWGGDIDGDTVNISGEQRSETRQVGNAGGNGGQSSSGGTSGGGASGPVIESRLLRDCPGAVPDSPQESACALAPVCPSEDPDAEPQLRMRLFQRELDPVTGDPISNWQLIGAQCTTIAEAAEFEATQGGGPSLLQLIIREWQSIQIPAATIGINPPDGRTLVNFDTIFYTTTGEQNFPVTLLGRSVVIYAIPVEYTWHHGDGTSQVTATGGAPYPSKEITHLYEQTGTVTPRVDVQYRAEFTVDGGERQPIPGFATVTGTSEELTILEARARLVDG